MKTPLPALLLAISPRVIWQKQRNKIIFFIIITLGLVFTINYACYCEQISCVLVRCNKTLRVTELEAGGTFGWKDTHSDIQAWSKVTTLVLKATTLSLSIHLCLFYAITEAFISFIKHPDYEVTLKMKNTWNACILSQQTECLHDSWMEMSTCGQIWQSPYY